MIISTFREISKKIPLYNAVNTLKGYGSIGNFPLWRSLTMKGKKFDCVEMMHRGAEAVKKKIRGMTEKEEIAFWRERSRELGQQQSETQGGKEARTSCAGIEKLQ
jgi:hypothetical protein